MTDNRKYDKELVDAIHRKEYVENVDGIDILFKPVPDDDRRHVMDPRLYATAEKKKRNVQSARQRWIQFAE